jgi:cytochrome c-type biogenesis protein CcmH
MTSNAFTMGAAFWLIAGVLLGVAVTLALSSLWRHHSARLGRIGGLTIALVSASAVIVVAVFLYLQLGRPDLTGATPIPHGGNVQANSAASSSIEQATEQLAARLARSGGSDADWELLAQSYEYMGRTEDAARARQHSISAGVTTQEANDALAAAQSLRAKRDFAGARREFEKLTASNMMTADSWADYADVLAALSNDKLAGAPAQAIDKALALNPNHLKAMWLKASLANEEHRYPDAVALWKQLRSLIDDSSSDAKIIDANIAEAEQLAANSPHAAQPSKLEVSGTIDIDAKLAKRATSGSILFVYAKSVDSPGPPLAVFRTTVNQWPVRFALNDSMAMMPGRNLSSATNVIIEARVSRSGQATASAGDLQAAGVRINPRDSKPVRLHVDKEVN